jgi:5-methylcytosine-specific restriction protein A
MKTRNKKHDVHYNHRWTKARKLFLDDNPLCNFCNHIGRIEAATVVDHIIPHKGDYDLFWNVNNWQALCTTCHASVKQRQENGLDIRPVGLDGWKV